ncbi:MAG: mercuric reductase [Gemmatimonadales bacterium]
MSFQPVGAADARLLEYVRPTAWVNPEPWPRYDLLVLGAGTGGLVSAAIGAALGARVALVERALMGGDCLNYGCVPSKAVLRAARSWAEARASAPRFGGPEAVGTGDFAAAMERMRALRADLAHVDGAARFRDMGVHVFFGEARFVSPEAVDVEGTRLRFRRAILATGARAAVPPIPGLAEAGGYTNETIFQLTRLPQRLLVLGAGPIGCELAQAFARFGGRVTLVDHADRPLPREEPVASRVLADALARDGVELVGGAKVTRVAKSSGRTTVVIERTGAERSLEGDALLIAVGRSPNVDLGLEAAGIEYDRRGVTVDARLRTTNRRVYAVGDVASRLQFTHVADAHARIAVRNALFFGRGKASDLVIPASTYTSPEVARVGPTAAELAEQGIAFETIEVPLDDVDRPRLDGANEGLLLVHVRRGKDSILGATLVAEHAGDIIAQLTQAMQLGVRLGKLGEVVFPYPTTAEVLRKAADRYRRTKLTPRAAKVLASIVRFGRVLP